MSFRKNFKNKFNQTKDSVLLPELEFRLGHVERVLTEENDVNDIIGSYPRVGNVSQLIVITPSKSLLPTKKRKLYAQPLLRGINDSITRGDAVMYVNVEGILFYLGPLNTTNNPNYTPDHTSNRTNTKYDDENGYHDLYPKVSVSKLAKLHALDPTPFVPISENKFSDLTLEGRHKNSIRIGSKTKYPLITISNYRNSGYESSLDGSHFSMFSYGSLREHFLSTEDERYNPSIFTLSCDNLSNSTDNVNPRGISINIGNDEEGGEELENIFQYENYRRNQIIMFSDRITFDAKNNDLTMSAFRNINFGAGKNFTISNKGFSVIETRNIYIGKEAKKREQPMVLGNELKDLLIKIMEILRDSRALVQGVPIPLVKQDSSPILPLITTILNELNTEYKPEYDEEKKAPIGDRSTGGPNFLSHHHFIESDRT